MAHSTKACKEAEIKEVISKAANIWLYCCISKFYLDHKPLLFNELLLVLKQDTLWTTCKQWGYFTKPHHFSLVKPYVPEFSTNQSQLSSK